MISWWYYADEYDYFYYDDKLGWKRERERERERERPNDE